MEQILMLCLMSYLLVLLGLDTLSKESFNVSVALMNK